MEKTAQTKLIETASPLFAKKGFAAVSIRELGQAAKVNSALISYHFGGKEGLYQAVLEEQFVPIAQLLLTLDDLSILPPAERLLKYAANIAVIHRQRPFLTRFLHCELTNPTPCGDATVKKYISQLFRFIRSALQEGVANGAFRADLQLDYATVSLAGIMNFYFIAKPLVKEFMPLSAQADEEYTAQAIDIFLYGIMRRTENE